MTRKKENLWKIIINFIKIHKKKCFEMKNRNTIVYLLERLLSFHEKESVI